MSRGLIWIIAGLLLGVAEAFLPGAFLLWIALAAAVVGVADLIFEPSLVVEMALFVVAAAVSVAVGRKFYGSMERLSPPQTLSRAHALIGHTYVLATAIVDGYGTMRVDDTVWRVTGAALPEGSHVKVASVVDGSLLRVEAA
jgi:inner membrane protein